MIEILFLGVTFVVSSIITGNSIIYSLDRELKKLSESEKILKNLDKIEAIWVLYNDCQDPKHPGTVHEDNWHQVQYTKNNPWSYDKNRPFYKKGCTSVWKPKYLENGQIQGHYAGYFHEAIEDAVKLESEYFPNLNKLKIEEFELGEARKEEGKKKRYIENIKKEIEFEKKPVTKIFIKMKTHTPQVIGIPSIYWLWE